MLEKTRFCIVTAAYNCSKYLDGCLGSIAQQNYKNYDVCIVDDASTDHLQREILLSYKESFNIIFNAQKVGAMANQVTAIKEICRDSEDVIVFLDGDDKFTDSGVLQYLDSIYSSNDKIDLTYGSYRSVPHSPTCPSVNPYPEGVIKTRSYRKFTSKRGIYFNHLRTFKYKLFQQMDEDIDFKDKSGQWFQTCTDTAMMIPALELADEHKYVEKVLVDYTSDNPISDWRVNAATIDKNHRYILTELPRKKR